MLKFISIRIPTVEHSVYISKHLMLKFILSYPALWLSSTNFKTSYVEVYPKDAAIPRTSTIFQNILCWSLSKANVIQSYLDQYFKTSYVEVYQKLIELKQEELTFQNILCWSLSWCRIIIFRFGRISKHLMLKFIIFLSPSSFSCAYFKTSYVEVYHLLSYNNLFQLIISKHLMLKFIFSLLFSFFCCSRISKHLMLKFINLFWACRLQVSLFQNILCWSLSQSSNKRGVLLPISKHLMLKFIKNPLFSILILASISKHLMLKFIRHNFRSAVWNCHFKTSYVEVYRAGFAEHIRAVLFQNILCWSLSQQNVAFPA